MRVASAHNRSDLVMLSFCVDIQIGHASTRSMLADARSELAAAQAHERAAAADAQQREAALRDEVRGVGDEIAKTRDMLNAATARAPRSATRRFRHCAKN